MKFNDFDCQIQATQQRLETLQQQATGSQSSPELSEKALTELSVVLEELHVASEELHTQNLELLNTRQALEQERQRYQELFEFAPDAYIVTDNQANIEEANSVAATMLNVSQNHLVGRPLSLFIAEAALYSFHSQINQLQSAPQSINDWEIEIQPREAPPFPVAISVSTRTDAQGKVQGWRWLLRDLRERKQAESLLRELEIQKHLNEFKTTLLGSISHEFRTPLNILLMSIGMMERQIPLEHEEQKQRICRRMRVAVQFLTLLLEQVEFFHYSYVSDPVLTPAIIELEPFCHRTIQEMQQFAADEREIRFECNSQYRSFRFDTKLLQQILRNLLSNALKYSPAGSIIFLKVNDQEGAIVFQIQDWGIGIPEGDRVHIYEPFYRGSNIDSISGVGLGLAVVKKAVDFCRGEIFLKSQVNAGTTFTIVLPLE